MKSSSSQSVDSRLQLISERLLRRHPANSNQMPGEMKQALRENIRLTGDYPPVIVRPHPTEQGASQILDGHNRVEILRDLDHKDITCYVWPCDDETALRLLATLNRLEGQDIPAKRAALLAELSEYVSPEELSMLLPESADEIAQTLKLLEFDVESLMADLETAARTSAETSPRLISFAVFPGDEAMVMNAVDGLAATLTGKNRRGKALAEICRQYMENATDA